MKSGASIWTPEVDRRLETDTSSPLQGEGWGGGQQPAIYLLIYGLQRARDLRQEDDLGYSFGVDEEEQPPSPAKQFPTILREGPDLGIHTLVWCDSCNNVHRFFSRQVLRDIELRVLFEMSEIDSTNLMDSPAASRLGQHRAILYDAQQGSHEKFRPYGLPAREWLNTVANHLRRRVVPAADD